MPDLQSDLREKFGLALPQNAIRTVLKRTSKGGYVRVEGVYYRNEAELEGLEFHSEQRRVLQEHDSFISEFVEFCSRHLGVKRGPEDADAALELYLEENQLRSGVNRGAIAPLPEGLHERCVLYLL